MKRASRRSARRRFSSHKVGGIDLDVHLAPHSVILHTMQSFELDDSALPLVLATFHNTNDAEAFADMEKRLRSAFDRAEKVIVINDIKVMALPDAAVRKRASDVDANLREATAKSVLLNIVIMRSKFTRGFMTALRWVNPAACPQAFVASRAEAAELAKKTFERAGLLDANILAKLSEYARAA